MVKGDKGSGYVRLIIIDIIIGLLEIDHNKWLKSEFSGVGVNYIKDVIC